MRIPVKNRFIAHRIIEGEGFVVDSRTQVLHHLNPVAAALWGWLDGRRTAEDLAALLCEEYDVDRETAARDVADFLRELAAKDVLEWREAEKTP